MEICKNYLKIIPSDLVFDIALTELSIADPTYFHMIWLLIHSELWMYTIQILFCQGIFPMEPYIILILSFVTTSQSYGNPFVRESHKGLPFLPKADAKQPSHILQYCYRQINVFCTWIKKQKGSSDFERRYVSGKNGNSCVLGLY